MTANDDRVGKYRSTPASARVTDAALTGAAASATAAAASWATVTSPASSIAACAATWSVAATIKPAARTASTASWADRFGGCDRLRGSSLSGHGQRRRVGFGGLRGRNHPSGGRIGRLVLRPVEATGEVRIEESVRSLINENRSSVGQFWWWEEPPTTLYIYWPAFDHRP